MDGTWLRKEELKKSERFFYSFPTGGVEEPFLFPLLCYRENSNYFLLDGWKRISLPLEKFPALFWDEEEKTPSEALQISIKANTIFRGINSIEKGNIARIVLKYFPDEVKNFAHLLNLNLDDFHRIARVNLLDDSVKTMISHWKIPPKWVIKMCEYPEEWNEIMDIIRGIKLTSSQMVWLIDSMYELSHRTGTPPSQIIKDLQPVATFEDLQRKIERVRYPVISRYNAIVRELQKKYQDSALRLSVPENFEGEEIILNLRIRSDADLEDIKNRIQKLLDEEKLRKILELL